MSLTDAQCAEIAEWAKGVQARGTRMAEIKVDQSIPAGDPVMASRTLFAHPEDYMSLIHWGDRQAVWIWPKETTP